MNRINLFVLLALLVGTPTLASLSKARIAQATQPTTPQVIAASVNIGWTKAQVLKQNGQPDRKSRDGNIWYYGGRAIQFTNGKVSGFPGAAG